MKNVLQAGVAKSGNFWLWKIIDEILKLDGAKKSYIKNHEIQKILETKEDLTHENQSETDVIDFERDGVYFRVSSIYKEKIEDFDAYLEEAQHVWTHSEMNEVGIEACKSFQKVVYIIRDPRDVVLSMANFSFTPYMMKYMPHGEVDVGSYLSSRLEWQVRSWVRHVCSWLRVKDGIGAYFVFYENLKNNPEKEIKALADYLEVSLDAHEVDRIVDLVSVDAMRVNNPNHVRKEEKKGWREELSDEQIALVEKISGELLKALGYDSMKSGASLTSDVNYSANEIYGFEKAANYSFQDKIRALISLLMSNRSALDKINVVKKYLR